MLIGTYPNFRRHVASVARLLLPSMTKGESPGARGAPRLVLGARLTGLLAVSVMRFQIGDRVRARESGARVKAEMIGTVVSVYTVLHDTYQVEFDDLPVPAIIEGAELEPISDAYEPVC